MHTGGNTGVPEYQTRAVAIQQVVPHAARRRVPYENPPEIVESGVVLDREVGVWRDAHVETGVTAAVTRVVLEPAVCGMVGGNAVTLIIRRQVVVRAGPVRVGEDDARPLGSPVW